MDCFSGESCREVQKKVCPDHQCEICSATTSRRGWQSIALCPSTSKSIRSSSSPATMLQAGGAAAGNRPEPLGSNISGPVREQACRSQLGDRGYARFEALKKAERQRGQSEREEQQQRQDARALAAAMTSPCLRSPQPPADTSRRLQNTDMSHVPC